MWTINTQKKSDVIATTDFQKTNYLKTNLLKQIKKISNVGLTPILSFRVQI